MLHTTQSEMLDMMMENPDEMFISSNSKHCAMFSTQDGAFLFLEGDFSGTPEECEAEVRRIMSELESTKAVVAS